LGQCLGPNHAQGPIHGPHAPPSPTPSRGPITRGMLKKIQLGFIQDAQTHIGFSHSTMSQRRCEDLKRCIKEQ